MNRVDSKIVTYRSCERMGDFFTVRIKVTQNQQYTALGQKLQFWEGEAPAEPLASTMFRLGRSLASRSENLSFGRAEYTNFSLPLFRNR